MSKSFLQSSRMISFITLISRITGLLRDILIASWLGNSWIQDRLSYAFAIPHLYRRLFGEGALSSAFIPVLSEKLAKEGKGAAGRLFGNVATLLGAVLIGLTAVLLMVILAMSFFHSDTIQAKLTLGLTAIMLPYMIFVCLVALFSGLMNCLDRFGLPAFMPIILNLFQISAVLFAHYVLVTFGIPKYHQVYVLGVAVLLAGVVQLVLMMRAVRRAGLKWGFDFSTTSPELKRIYKMILPVMFGLGILQIGAWFDNQLILSLTAGDKPAFTLFGKTISYPLAEGALSSVTFARRLYNLPLGVLGIALATAAFPRFGRYVAEGNYEKLSESVNQALRQAIFQGLPSGIGLIILADLIVRVVFQRGAFSAHNTAETAYVLKFYSIGLWAYCAHHIILRAFYSLNDMVTPLRVMMLTLILNVAMNVTLLWIPSIRQAIFGLSTAIMVTINVIVLSMILSKRIGKLDSQAVVICAMKTLIAAMIMAGVVYLTESSLVEVNKYAKLAICVFVGIIAFFSSAFLLKMPEVKELFSR